METTLTSDHAGRDAGVVPVKRGGASFRAKLADLLAFVAFLLAAVAMTWPLTRHAATRVWGGPIDPVLVSFIVGWQDHSLFTNPLKLNDAPYFYPFPNALLLSEQLLGGSILVLPLWMLTHNAVLAANLMVLLTFPIAAFGAYLLLRDVTGSRLAGLAAGIIFGFSAYRLSSLWASHVLLTMWIPYALVLLRRFLRSQSWRYGIGLALVSGLQIASSGHGALMLAVGLPLVAMVLIAHRPGVLRSLKLWTRGLVAAALLSLMVVPFVLPYAKLYRENKQFVRPRQELVLYSGGPRALATAPARNVLYGNVFNGLRHDPLNYEKSLFPGVAVLLLASLGCLGTIRSWNRRELRSWGIAFVCLSLFGAAMSIGASAHADGVFGFFHRWAPGFDRIRVPGRFAILTTLGLAGLGGMAIPFLLVLGKTKRRFTAVFVAAAFLMMGAALAEGLTGPEPMIPLPRVPAVYRWLAGEPRERPVLEIPTGEPDGRGDVTSGSFKRESTYLYFSTKHWRPIMNGYAGNIPRSYIEMVQVVFGFPSRPAVDYLRRIGVRYVIVHRNMMDPGTPWFDLEKLIRLRAPNAVVRNYESEFVLDLEQLAQLNLPSLRGPISS